MIDFTGFASGYQQRGDYNQGKRREMAEAFSKFKADNPYATQADFQSFIDQYSGGRNYIAGGAPSSEILASLAENNLRAKKLNEANQNLDMFNKQTDVKNKLTGLIEEKLLSLKPDNNGQIDYVKAADEFRNEYGMLMPEGDNIFTDGMGFTGRFNDAKRNLLVSKQIQEFMPQALNLIESSNGKIDDNALQMMGVPASMMTQVKQAAQKKYMQDQQTRMFNNQGKLIDRAVSMISSGSTLTEDSIGMLAQSLGISTSTPEAKQYLSNIKSEAERIRGIENTRLENEAQDRKAEIKIKFRKTLETDDLFVKAIRTGNQADAKRRIAYYTQEFQPATRDFIISAGDALISDFENSLQLFQTDLLGEKRQKADASALTVLQAYPKSNMAKAEAHFGSVAKPNPNAGAQGGNAVLATQDLSKAFDLNTSSLVLLQEVYKNAEPGSDRSTLVQLGREALQANGAETVANAKQQLRSSTTLSQGGFGRPETFENWKSKTSDTIKTHFDTIDNKLDAVIALPATNIKEKEIKIRRLNFLLSASMQGVNAISENIKFADKYSMGKDTWITYGTPQWDGTKVQSELTDVMKKRLLDANKAIDEELKEVNALQFGSPAPNSNNSFTPTGASSWDRFWDMRGKKVDRNDALFQNLVSKGIQDTGGYTSSFTGLKGQFGSYSPQQLSDNEMVYKFLFTPGNLEEILTSKEMYVEFNNDPLGFVKTQMNMSN